MTSKDLKKLIKDVKRGEESARETLAYTPIKELHALGAFETLEPSPDRIEAAQSTIDACASTDERLKLIIEAIEKYKRKPERKAQWYAVEGGFVERLRVDKILEAGFVCVGVGFEPRPRWAYESAGRLRFRGPVPGSWISLIVKDRVDGSSVPMPT